jgi:hypothetical protein
MGEEFPRLRRLMAEDPRVRGSEPDHYPGAIPEAISHGPLKGVTPSPPYRVLGVLILPLGTEYFSLLGG